MAVDLAALRSKYGERSILLMEHGMMPTVVAAFSDSFTYTGHMLAILIHHNCSPPLCSSIPGWSSSPSARSPAPCNQAFRSSTPSTASTHMSKTSKQHQIRHRDEKDIRALVNFCSSLVVGGRTIGTSPYPEPFRELNIVLITCYKYMYL